MKKIISVILAVFVLGASLAVPAFAQESRLSADRESYYKNLGLQGTTLNVYNWGEYINDEDFDVIGEFQRLTGCKVNYTTFESNENMYSKLSGGGVSYDIIVPSDYTAEKLMKEDMLLKPDFNNIPNYDKYFDKERYGSLLQDGMDEYAVIYNVGTTILIYNKKYVKEKPDSWSVLWDEQYKNRVLMMNNPRDTFAVAQAMLGQSFNSQNKEDWDAAYELLKEQRKRVAPEYVMDEIFIKMESGDYALAVYYAGDYELMVENNSDLGFAFPKEGVNTFYDALCIPRCAQNKKGAEAFINFMLEPEVAIANAEYIYYATPNKAVMENDEYSLIESEAVYPKEPPKSQFFHSLPNDTLQYMNRLWTKLKGENNTKGLYAGFFGTIGAITAVCVVHIILKERRKRYYNV